MCFCVCVSPTPVIFTLDVRLLAVTVPGFAVSLCLMAPDHQASVATANRYQETVVMGPPHVGHMGAVSYVALELCILPL